MKKRIWKKRKTAVAVLIMICFLLMGRESTILGAEVEKYDQKTAFTQEDRQNSESISADFEMKNEEISESDESEINIVPEDMEEAGLLENMEMEELPELSQIPEVSEVPDRTEEPSFSDQGGKKIQPGCKIWIIPEQEQIKAGKELIYTVKVENTGNCTLWDIQLSASFSEKSLKGVWEESENAVIQDKILKLKMLETGICREFYLCVQIPEEQSGKFQMHLSGSAEYRQEEAGEKQIFTVEESRETEILPLKADFQVTKTADRTMAVPGDAVVFQICIRNTGERTLHSVITTEKFQLENIPVRFLEAEGISLNKNRTKARIEKIEPGNSVGLLAEVVLPEKLDNQKLVNEVIVTTAETGERKVTSKAEIQVYRAGETLTATPETFSDESTENQKIAAQSQSASTHPKTGDPMKPDWWFLMISGSLLTVAWVRRQTDN